MSEELKPCPFCGGEAEIVDAEECGPQAYVVTCNGCMTSSRVIFALMDDVTFDLVSAWNTRADLLPVVKPLVWEDVEFVTDQEVTETAECLGHEYHIGATEDGWFFFDCTDQKEVGGLGGAAEAKAAAQADHAARIRACLDMIDPAALVAGAYEAAAGKLAKAAQAEAEINNPHDAELLWHMEKRIRDLTPADAQDALDAAIRKAVNGKLDEAVSKILAEAEAYRGMGFLASAQALNIIAGDVLAMKGEE